MKRRLERYIRGIKIFNFKEYLDVNMPFDYNTIINKHVFFKKIKNKISQELKINIDEYKFLEEFLYNELRWMLRNRFRLIIEYRDFRRKDPYRLNMKIDLTSNKIKFSETHLTRREQFNNIGFLNAVKDKKPIHKYYFVGLQKF